jgi:elongator complex protein 3
MPSALAQYCLEVIDAVEHGRVKNKRELNVLKQKLARKYGLSHMPTNPTILSFAKQKTTRLKAMLGKRPQRSLSGINVIAVMYEPSPCPGKCIYCPSSLVNVPTPKSYTGLEPATMRALQHNFDAAAQVKARIRQLEETGHIANKLELIIMGGTFLAQSRQKQQAFIKACIDAVTGHNSKTLEEAKKHAEYAQRRIIGITFETRPDYAKRKHVNMMLEMGGTRCELGVQILDDEVYKINKRGHTVEHVVDATRNLKDAGFKICYHMMPGMYGSSEGKDRRSFKLLFEDVRFRPDMLKLYPCLAVRNTKLAELQRAGKFKPLSTEEAAEFIAWVKRTVPLWVRIMRIQRDIPAKAVEGGVDKSNLRQIVHKKLKVLGLKCRCIRCREAGLNAYLRGVAVDGFSHGLFVERYEASSGTELFLSVEDKRRELLFGYCRLRVPECSYRPEITSKAAIIRELRVFGQPLPLHKRSRTSLQHQGMGAELLSEAERIALEEFDRKKMVVIAGLGVKEYYREKFGYEDDGPYVSKMLV